MKVNSLTERINPEDKLDFLPQTVGEEGNENGETRKKSQEQKTEVKKPQRKHVGLKSERL